MCLASYLQQRQPDACFAGCAYVPNLRTFLDSFVLLKEWGANIGHSLVSGGCLEGDRDYVTEEREICEIYRTYILWVNNCIRNLQCDIYRPSMAFKYELICACFL